MDIWGGDPWNDSGKNDAAVEKEPKEVRGAGFLAGFEDEAGWGDFEESVGDDGWKGRETKKKGKEEEEKESGDQTWSPEKLELRIPAHPPDGQSTGWNRSPTSSSASGSSSASVTLSSPRRSPNPEPIPYDVGHQELHTQAPQSTNSDIHVVTDNVLADHKEVGIDSPRSLGTSTGEGEKTINLSPSSSGGSVIDDSKSQDSQRTSLEEPLPGSNNWKRNNVFGEAIAPTGPLNENTEEQDDEFGDSNSGTGTKEDTCEDENDIDGNLDDLERTVSRGQTIGIKNGHLNTSETASAKSTPGPNFQYDVSLINKIFKHPRKSKNLAESEEGVISASSSRRAWYRITRPATMREINEGATDNSYVRVSWPRSNVRKEVLKTVSRWASEDTVNGKAVLGGGLPGSATFGWDESTPASSTNPSRPNRGMKNNTSIVQGSGSRSPVGLAQQQSSKLKPPTVSKTIVEHESAAQFSWSTSPTADDPPAQLTISSIDGQMDSLFGPPLTTSSEKPKSSAFKHGSRSASLNLKSPIISSHHRSTTVVDANAQISDFIGFDQVRNIGHPSKLFPAPPAIPPPNAKADPNLRGTSIVSSSSPSPLKIDTTPSVLDSKLDDESEDEWGEMVKSPSLPTTPVRHTPEPTVKIEAPAQPITPEPIPAQLIVPDPIAAPPIEAEPALRRAKRPTPILSYFPNQATYVPAQLSPARKAAFEAARVTRTLSSQQKDDSPSVDVASVHLDRALDFTVVEKEVPELSSVSHLALTPENFPPSSFPPSIETLPVDAKPLLNKPLFDADFSVFNAPSTGPPITPSSSTHPHRTMSPTLSRGSMAKSETSPPQLITSVILDDDEDVRQVLHRLPDLSYMLR
jgi:hypothetical protein